MKNKNEDRFIKTCPECNRSFDLLNDNDSEEWFYGHDCEVEDSNEPF